MLDLKLFEGASGKQALEEYKKDLLNRGEELHSVDLCIELNQERKKHVFQTDLCRTELKELSQKIVISRKNNEPAQALTDQVKDVKQKLKDIQNELQSVENELKQILLRLPNRCDSSVPKGQNEDSNVLVKSVGEKTQLSFFAKSHDQIGEDLDILDFKRASKVSGARFVFLKGQGALLERALLQMMMDMHSQEHGYTEIIPPFLVNAQSLIGTGQFPKFSTEVFHIQDYDLRLIPTAEVPLTGYYAGEILKEDELPICFVGYSPCFRAEAGSYGKDTKGLVRQHQFNKVELVQFVLPEQSYECHETLTRHAERVLEKLELPYRRMLLCAGDMSDSASKCFDLEVWLPGQKKYREVSSCSNFEDFQSRRSNIRYRGRHDKSLKFVLTLNGSGLAIGRSLLAILENYQQEDGTVRVPKALQNYMGGLKVLGRK